jgi:peptide/nickel transport system substrate-binding protein
MEEETVTDRTRELLGIVRNSGEVMMTRRKMLMSTAMLGVGATLLAACDPDDDEVVDDVPVIDDDDEEEPAADPDDDDAEVDPDEDEDMVDDDLAEEDDEEDDADVGDDEHADRYGGELRIAIIGEPPSLDLHMSTATVSTLVSAHMFEFLFTWDEEFEVTPDLVDDWEVADDGLTNRLHLRQGVMFHNGDEFTAEDAYASIDRWANVLAVGFGVELMEKVDEMEVEDDYTLTFHMNEPFGTFAVALGRQSNSAAIYPAELVEEAGDGTLSELVGTGPYQFVEAVADQHILVERFEDYSYRDEAANGYGGRKYAYADTIRFIPVPDEAARVAGIQAGDYDYLESVGSEQFEALEDDPNVVAETGPPASNDLILFNLDQGPMTDITLRRAVQATVDCEELLTAAHGEGFFRLDPGHMWQETIWHSTAGEELYNMADPELGAEYLEEAGYDGETIRIITTQEYMDMYYTAVVLEQQLEDIGMNVEVEVFDWSTLLETRGDMTAWDIAITGFAFRVDPAQILSNNCSWGGRWCSEEKEELVGQMLSEVDLDTRIDLWEQVQALAYEEAAFLKVGEENQLLVYSPRIHDVNLTQLVAAFWNVYIEE